MPQILEIFSHPSAHALPESAQLAWHLAGLSASQVPILAEVREEVKNRIIDNAAVALASISRAPVQAARDQALAHEVTAASAGSGAALTGLPDSRVSPEWAAWANGVAVRELDFHDTFLAAEYAHPGDNIPPLLAVAQHRGLDGAGLIRAIAAAYEAHISLARAIDLHSHRIDHVAHLGPSVAVGLGALLGADRRVIFHAIGQALHTTTATRQSRKGEISTWKAYAPAFAGKQAIEAMDRALRGQTSPAPIYEGEDGVIAWLLGGTDAHYSVGLPAVNEPFRAILDSFTKEYSAEYQAQAFIDLARRLRAEHPDIGDATRVRSILVSTSDHTHRVIGSGSEDPEKYDPRASRETLDHSLPYILAVALQDGSWHHEDSYLPARAARADTLALWQRIQTREDPDWTKRYHAPDPRDRAFGGAIRIEWVSGEITEAEIVVADAHPRGARPFNRERYEEKFRTLATGVISDSESERFLGAVAKLETLSAGELAALNLDLTDAVRATMVPTTGLF